jgi:hypothetical protein
MKLVMPQHLTVSATSLLPTSPIVRPYKLQRITQKTQDYSSAPIGKRPRGHPPGHWNSSAREAPRRTSWTDDHSWLHLDSALGDLEQLRSRNAPQVDESNESPYLYSSLLLFTYLTE